MSKSLRCTLVVVAAPIFSMALVGSPFALSASNTGSKSLHLTGVVIKARSVRAGDAMEQSSTIGLRSGSKTVGSLTFKECSGEAVTFLDCEGKGGVKGLGSGLETRFTWKCSETGKGGCASVGEGLFFGKTGSVVANYCVKAPQSAILKLHKEFPVVVRTGG